MQKNNNIIRKNKFLSFICYLLSERSGFTLIEVLVAATLIGLLSTIGLTGFQAVTRSGRDALRKSDLEAIRSALEIYKSENDQYPTNASPNDCIPDGLDSSYIDPYPSDPRPEYQYCYLQVDALNYELCAHIENGTDSSDGCGSSNYCSDTCNYQVEDP